MVVRAIQMIERLKEISLYIVAGFMMAGIGDVFGSVFLEEYLKENLITLLIALLAINTTTSSVIMTKLKDISDATGGNFKFTIEQLRSSTYEQVALILIAVILLILAGSKTIVGIHIWIHFVLNGFVTSVFVAGLYTLFDTAKSIFVILRYENRDKQ
ncbi:hypothetical protein HAP94_11635 [Acidithiobacillus ferrivorans]|nr:hypothetical protein [Acidithiobacillus ferrivorans]